MSLDILHCRVVPSVEANHSYRIEDYPQLKRLQPSGILTVHETRIGRNCLEDTWQDLVSDVVSRHNLDPRDNLEMCIVFPEEVEDKLLKYIVKNFDHYVWFYADQLKDFDFIFISW